MSFSISDASVPLVVLDLASVDTYLLAGPLSSLAPESAGALWCPLISEPTPLDRDRNAARACAEGLELPLAWPERHPAAVPRAMRVAALASMRGCAASFMLGMSRLAFGSGIDLEGIGRAIDWERIDPQHPERFLLAVEDDMGMSVQEAASAVLEGSAADVELALTAHRLARAGVSAAPALRWQGTLYLGACAISPALAKR